MARRWWLSGSGSANECGHEAATLNPSRPYRKGIRAWPRRSRLTLDSWKAIPQHSWSEGVRASRWTWDARHLAPTLSRLSPNRMSRWLVRWRLAAARQAAELRVAKQDVHSSPIEGPRLYEPSPAFLRKVLSFCARGILALCSLNGEGRENSPQNEVCENQTWIAAAPADPRPVTKLIFAHALVPDSRDEYSPSGETRLILDFERADGKQATPDDPGVTA